MGFPFPSLVLPVIILPGFAQSTKVKMWFGKEGCLPGGTGKGTPRENVTAGHEEYED